MQAREQRDGSVRLTVSRDELRILNNSINETLEALNSEEEFSIRVGVTTKEARALLGEFRTLYDRLPKL